MYRLVLVGTHLYYTSSSNTALISFSLNEAEGTMFTKEQVIAQEKILSDLGVYTVMVKYE